MTMVLGIAFVLLVSLVLSAGLSAVGTLLGNVLPGGAILWQIVNFLLSFAVITRPVCGDLQGAARCDRRLERCLDRGSASRRCCSPSANC